MNRNNEKEFIIEGIDCAVCAGKIEDKVRNLPEIKDATINFITKKLNIVFKNEDELEENIKKVVRVIKDMEPSAKITLKKENKIGKISGNTISVNKKNVENNQCKCGCCGHECNETVDIKISGHTNEHSNVKSWWDRKKEIKLAVGLVLFISGFGFRGDMNVNFAIYLACILVVGSEVIIKALKNILRGEVFDENLLMTIAAIGAFAIGEFSEGAAVMLFYNVGEYFQDKAVDKSRKSIEDLMDIRPEYANLKIDNEIKKVSPEEASIGDIIVVKPGEKVPLDGKVIEGSSFLDTSALTGEAVPREAVEGSEVLAGFINKNGLITIKVVKEFSDSTVSKILELVQNASNRKAKTENFITKFAKYYTPIVVFSAIALAFIPPLIVEGALFSDWMYRALVFLVVSCPCALVISVPLGYFGGIGNASKKGILIKGSSYLEALNDSKIFVFDKTGTLTKGEFKVTEVKAKENVTSNELLKYAAYAESFSNHPIAISIVKEYGKDINKEKIKDYKEILGKGIAAKVDGNKILIGNYKLMAEENIKCNNVNAFGTVIYIAIDGKCSGYIIISDEIKEDSLKTINGLKDIGVENTIILSGDKKEITETIGSTLGVNEVYGELLPNEKIDKLEDIYRKSSKGEKVVFVGDGINDAPSLQRADVGIAMGGLGSDAAIEAADVVIMEDKPSKIIDALKIAKNTKNIVWQNIIFALGVKILVLILSAFGFATMWEGVFADVGVTLLAVLNSMRALRD